MAAAKQRDRSSEIGRLFDEIVLLYLRLNAFAEQLYRKGRLSGARRTVLATLARTGPQTVAQMARRRAQPRQRFQPLVNALIDEGLLEAVPNPAHKQSPLIRLTAQGKKVVRDIHDLEQRGRRRLKVKASTRAISESIDIIRDVRSALEHEMGHPRWTE